MALRYLLIVLYIFMIYPIDLSGLVYSDPLISDALKFKFEFVWISIFIAVYNGLRAPR